MKRQARLNELIDAIADALVAIDRSREAFKSFKPGIGPYGEPQLTKAVALHLNQLSQYSGIVRTKRSPDLLIAGHWAIEIKIARPFGDNGKAAENWSVNLLHPYEGHESVIGDCLKLLNLNIPESKAVLVIGYEHNPPVIDLSTSISALELIASEIVGVRLGERIEVTRQPLVHPVHQRLRLFGWEVIGLINHRQ